MEDTTTTNTQPAGEIPEKSAHRRGGGGHRPDRSKALPAPRLRRSVVTQRDVEAALSRTAEEAKAAARTTTKRAGEIPRGGGGVAQQSEGVDPIDEEPSQPRDPFTSRWGERQRKSHDRRWRQRRGGLGGMARRTTRRRGAGGRRPGWQRPRLVPRDRPRGVAAWREIVVSRREMGEGHVTGGDPRGPVRRVVAASWRGREVTTREEGMGGLEFAFPCCVLGCWFFL